jgi:hypothetical protein
VLNLVKGFEFVIIALVVVVFLLEDYKFGSDVFSPEPFKLAEAF